MLTVGALSSLLVQFTTVLARTRSRAGAWKVLSVDRRRRLRLVTTRLISLLFHSLLRSLVRRVEEHLQLILVADDDR